MALLALAALACQGARPMEVSRAPTPAAVPAGVDSAVAAAADSLAEASFVDLDRQERAALLQEQGRVLAGQSDSLWEARDRASADARLVTPDDSVRAEEATMVGGLALLQLDRAFRDSSLSEADLARRTAVLLDSAESALERSYGLNPFDTRTTLWLARVYDLQARRLGRAERFEHAILTLEKLARLTPDEHTVFAMLANVYYRLEQWGPAAEHYRRAEEVYLATSRLDPDAAERFDSALVYSYVRAQADMHVRQQAAEPAAVALTRALAFARGAADSAYVQGELAWMAWDDMNIASSVARDSLAALAASGQFAAARDGYRALQRRLRAPKAVDEIDWRLAIAEYNLGSVESAAERLRALVHRIELTADGLAADSHAQRYLDDFGTLCLNVGRQFLHEQRDNRTALKYFAQATQIRWDGRAVAHLEMATLLQANVPAALEAATKAFREEHTLSVPQRLDLYRLLMGLYRRAGDFVQARRFQEAYRVLRGS